MKDYNLPEEPFGHKILYLLFLTLFHVGAHASETKKSPNVIFIFVDDQGYYDLGCYGATEVKTPRIDVLAREGVPLLRNGEVVLRKPDPGSLSRLYTEEAISWIEERVAPDRNEPFFLYLPHTMLHHPLGISPEFEGSSEWGLYGDAIQELDFYVGRIVDALERLEIEDETILVYASDNGRQGGQTDNLRRWIARSVYCLRAGCDKGRSYIRSSGSCDGLVSNISFTCRDYHTGRSYS